MNRAMWYVIFSTSLYSVINVGVKFLGHLPPSQIVVFRASTSLLICAFFIWKKGGTFVGQNKKLLLARGLFGTIALFSLFICIQKIPLAVAMTLINLTPIMTVVIAHFYLKERASGAQWILLLFSFIGVIMVRGGLEPVPWVWMLLGLMAAFFASLTYTCVRQLRLTEDPLLVILYFPLVTLPLVAPVMYIQWVPPQGWDWPLLFGIGALTQVAQYYMTLGYHMEKAAKVMIFNYIGLFWGVFFGWTVFHESLSAMQFSGVLLVFVCLCTNYVVSNYKKSVVGTRV